MLFFIAVGAPLWLAFLLTASSRVLVLGVGFKTLIVDPLIKHGVIPLVIATLGLSIAVKSTVRAATAPRRIPFPSPSPAAASLAGINVSYADIGTLVLAGAIVVGLQAFLNKTVTGARCRPSRRTPKRAKCSASTSSAWCSTCS
jgi:branched-chain amino acid transport system permease protein